MMTALMGTKLMNTAASTGDLPDPLVVPDKPEAGAEEAQVRNREPGGHRVAPEVSRHALEQCRRSRAAAPKRQA